MEIADIGFQFTSKLGDIAAYFGDRFAQAVNKGLIDQVSLGF